MAATGDPDAGEPLIVSRSGARGRGGLVSVLPRSGTVGEGGSVPAPVIDICAVCNAPDELCRDGLFDAVAVVVLSYVLCRVDAGLDCCHVDVGRVELGE